MRVILVIAGAALAAALILPPRFDRLADTVSSVPARTAVRAGASTRALAVTEVRVPADARGHFLVDGRVDDTPITFVVDTGASLVAIRRSDAERAGINLRRLRDDMEVSTANGVVRAAGLTLPSVAVGAIELSDVEAIVLPDDLLAVNLLGTSFLGRLRSVEITDGRLTLSH